MLEAFKIVAASVFLLAFMQGQGAAKEVAQLPLPGTEASPHGYLISSTEDFRGALMRMRGNGAVLIEELIFGIDDQQHIFPAYLKGIHTKTGAATEVDRRDHALMLLNTTDLMRGMYSTHGGVRVWVEGLQFGLNSNGFLVTAGVKGFLDSGQAVGTGVFAAGPSALQDVQTACACLWEVSCRQGLCSGQCGTPPGCDCTGTGNCAQVSTCVCPAAGACDLSETCQADGLGDCECM